MTRRQLTLFVPPDAAAEIEAVRRAVDPVQHALIAAHVTMAREDELEGLDDLPARLTAFRRGGPISLTFGPAEAFGGHGLLLPCIHGESAFHDRRRDLLGPSPVRRHPPHLTLAHPRNPIAPGNRLDAARRLAPALRIPFPSIALIEQTDGSPWTVRARYDLS